MEINSITVRGTEPTAFQKLPVWSSLVWPSRLVRAQSQPVRRRRYDVYYRESVTGESPGPPQLVPCSSPKEQSTWEAGQVAMRSTSPSL